MADNNTQEAAKCGTSEAFRHATSNAEYFTYSILVFPYFLLGILGHGLFLVACSKQTKQEAAYVYQLFLAAAKILEICSFTILSLAFNRWAGLGNEGAYWYRSQYALMWFAAHANIPLVNGFINSCLFLSLCMAMDRVMALAAPHTYRHVVSKYRVRISALLVSLVIGFLIVAFDTLRFVLEYDPKSGMYSLQPNVQFVSSVTAIVFANIRNGILIFAVLILTTCNVAVIIMYRQKMLKKTDQQYNGDRRDSRAWLPANDVKAKKRKDAEKALILLTICQSTVNIVGVGFLASFFVLVYLAPDFVKCQGLLVSPILDATLQIASLLDFYVLLIASRSFRRMVLPWCHQQEAAAIVPSPGLSGHNAMQAQSNRLRMDSIRF